MVPVLLVRHAHALSRSDWKGDDSVRELSDRGRKQSLGLVDVLEGYEPKRLISSPYVRCMDTLVPAGSALGMMVEPDEALAEGASSAAARLVRQLMDDSVVLCSHGDVIPRVLDQLAGEDRFSLGRNPRNEKGSVWVLTVRKGRFVRADYLRPPGSKASSGSGGKNA